MEDILAGIEMLTGPLFQEIQVVVSELFAMPRA